MVANDEQIYEPCEACKTWAIRKPMKKSMEFILSSLELLASGISLQQILLCWKQKSIDLQRWAHSAEPSLQDARSDMCNTCLEIEEHHCSLSMTDLEKAVSGVSVACGHFVGNHAILRTF